MLDLRAALHAGRFACVLRGDEYFDDSCRAGSTGSIGQQAPRSETLIREKHAGSRLAKSGLRFPRAVPQHRLIVER
jgi:hypothetical protein